MAEEPKPVPEWDSELIASRQTQTLIDYHQLLTRRVWTVSEALAQGLPIKLLMHHLRTLVSVMRGPEREAYQEQVKPLDCRYDERIELITQEPPDHHWLTYAEEIERAKFCQEASEDYVNGCLSLVIDIMDKHGILLQYKKEEIGGPSAPLSKPGVS